MAYPEEIFKEIVGKSLKYMRVIDLIIVEIKLNGKKK